MKVLLSHDTIQARVREMGRQIAADYAGHELHVVGVLKGACTFMTDLCRTIDIPLTLDYIAVASYGAAQVVRRSETGETWTRPGET
jgi:hypoxanthine phosphoribosyltransferase